jgi:glycosyltransferase involved in cell wall biosynthesis
MKKKKIAVIAHGCRSGGGLVGTLSLLRAFKDVAENEEVLLICSAGYGYEQIELPSGSQRYVYQGSQSPMPRQWFERITLPRIIDAYNPDVIFGPGNIGLTKPRAPQAIFIRIPYLLYERKKHYPNVTGMERVRFVALKDQVKTSLSNGTNLVFVQTPVVQERFSKEFNYPQEKIKVFRLTAPPDIQVPADNIEPPIFKKADNIFYVLLMTRYLSHRNPDILISLCQRYGRDIRQNGIKFITTITPGEHRFASRFLKNISRNNFEDIIVNAGRLSRPEVAQYLAKSRLLWLPTMMETLCLPFLEAMKTGTTIMAPDLDFARYVCGDAAIYYDPWDIDSMFNCLLKVRNNEQLRQQYIEKGRKELLDASKFAANWQDTAKFCLESLKEIAK